MANFLKSTIKALDSVQNAINNNNPLINQNNLNNGGFGLTATPSADGNGLPYTKIASNRDANMKRNIITWFIPEFGIVRMYVNPEAITYSYKKLIHKDRTKGGYTLQYWGEDLTTLNITGTTGSAGVEGINVLYEIYRAEQYAFDGVGLTLAANNAAADLANNLVQGVGGALGGAINGLFGGNSSSPTAAATGAGLLGGILGLDSPNNNLSAKNIPSLGQLAFTVEMYYGGKVFRGFFENLTVNERAGNFLMEYQITFTATQIRGYRGNRFGFERSANNGPSNYNTPGSFSGQVSLDK